MPDWTPSRGPEWGDAWTAVEKVAPAPGLEVLYPNGIGDETGISGQYPAYGNHWGKVDEIVADDFSTYVFTYSTGYQRDLYHIEDTIQAGNITNVRLCFRVGGGDAVDAALAKGAIKTNGEVYETAEEESLGVWGDFYHDWAVNPQTGEVWTWDEINSLQIGISLKSPDGVLNSDCTQVYVEVSWDEAPVQTILITQAKSDIQDFLDVPGQTVKIVQAKSDIQAYLDGPAQTIKIVLTAWDSIVTAPPKLTWLNVYDTSGILKARIFECRIDECNTRSNTFGILRFPIHQDAQGRAQLVKGRWIEVFLQTASGGDTLWSGIICHVKKILDENGDPTRYYEITARSFEWLLYWRRMVPDSGQDYFFKSGSKVDDAAKYLVRYSMVSGAASAARAITGFYVETDQGQHADTKTLAGRYEDKLGAKLEQWAKARKN